MNGCLAAFAVSRRSSSNAVLSARCRNRRRAAVRQVRRVDRQGGCRQHARRALAHGYKSWSLPHRNARAIITNLFRHVLGDEALMMHRFQRCDWPYCRVFCQHQFPPRTTLFIDPRQLLQCAPCFAVGATGSAGIMNRKSAYTFSVLCNLAGPYTSPPRAIDRVHQSFCTLI